MSYYMSDWEVVCSANNEGATLPQIPENYGAIPDSHTDAKGPMVVVPDKSQHQGSKFAAALFFGAAIWLLCRD